MASRRSALFFLAVPLLLLAARAEAKTITVKGSGRAVVTGNQAMAHSQAVNMALRNAVEHAARTVGGPAEGDDATVDKQVYGRAAAFTPRSTLIHDDVDGNIITVELSVDVDLDALTAALGGRRGTSSTGAGKSGGGGAATGLGLGGKRVLILATEQLGPQQFLSWTDVAFHLTRDSASLNTKTTVMKINNEMGGIEATMSTAFSDAGFDVIDPSVLRGKIAPRPAYEVLDLTPGAAVQIARKTDADLVVIAKGTAMIAHVGGELAQAGMHSGQGNVVARLIRIKDGKVLAAATEHAAQIHLDLDTAKLNAINEASRMAAGTLTKKVLGE